MPIRFRPGAVPTVRLFGALLLALPLLTAAAPGHAQTQDLVLENIVHKDGGRTVTIQRVTVEGSSLGREEVARIFSPDGAEALRRFSARRVDMPLVEIVEDQGPTIRLSGFEMSSVTAGRVGSLVVTGIDGGDSTSGLTFFSGRIEASDLDLPAAFGAVARLQLQNLRFARLSLAGLTVAFPADASEPDKVVRIAMAQALATSENVGDLSLKSRYQATGLTIEPPDGSEQAQMLALFGVPRLELDFSAAGTYDPATKTLDLSEMLFKATSLATLGLTFRLGDVADAAVNFTSSEDQIMAALAAGTFVGAELSLVDAGLAGKLLAFAARREGKPEAAYKDEVKAMVRQMLPVLFGGDPAGGAVATAVERFLDDPKRTLRIAAKPKGAPFPLTEFGAVTSPIELLGKIALTATAEP